jgi:hypothetical protein
MSEFLNFQTPCDDLDEVLRGFFRSKMPDPWPALPLPADPKPMPRSRSWSRLLVAASVAFVLAGYLTLAGFFPGPEIPTPIPASTIGQNPNSLRVPTRSGGEAIIFEQKTDNGVIFQVQEIKGPKNGR